LVIDSVTTCYASFTIVLHAKFILGFIKRKEGQYFVCLTYSAVITLAANNAEQ